MELGYLTLVHNTSVPLFVERCAVCVCVLRRRAEPLCLADTLILPLATVAVTRRTLVQQVDM